MAHTMYRHILVITSYYYYHCKQENALYVTTFHNQFIQKCKCFIFDIIYGWKAQLLLYSNQKTLLGILSKQKLLVPKDWYLKLYFQFFLGNGSFCHKWYIPYLWLNFVSGIFWLIWIHSGFILFLVRYVL